jgi:hypothetical protein
MVMQTFLYLIATPVAIDNHLQGELMDREEAENFSMQ